MAPVIRSAQGAYLTIGRQKVLNVCSNNYLGLANDPRLKKAAVAAITKYGVGTSSVRTLAGTHELHLELEKELARFKKAEAAIVFSSGYLANLAGIQTTLGKEDIVVSDELNHASIIDAIRLAQVKQKYIYRHADMSDLEEKLKLAAALRKTPKTDGKKPAVLIVTDGVFSMDGEVASLPTIVALAKKYQAQTLVDDAHGEGVLGWHGAGLVDHFALHGQVDLEVGTLSKAFGVLGGFIAGRKILIDQLRRSARQFLFSNSLSIPDTAALIAAVKILEASDVRLKKLWQNTFYLKRQLKRAGFDIGKSTTPITPVMIGDEEKAVKFSQRLFAENVFAAAIKFPMVPPGKARLRLMPSAAHTKRDLDIGIKAIIKVAKELGVQ